MRGSPVVAGDPAVSRPLMVPIWFYVASGASQAREARRRLTAACVRRADRPRAYVEPCSITACSRTSPGMIASRVIGRSRLRRSQSTHTPGLPAVTCPLGESGRLTRWSSCPDSDKRSVAVGIVGFGPVGTIAVEKCGRRSTRVALRTGPAVGLGEGRSCEWGTPRACRRRWFGAKAAASCALRAESKHEPGARTLVRAAWRAVVIVRLVGLLGWVCGPRM